jgi:putative sigma-54 modulation protein
MGKAMDEDLDDLLRSMADIDEAIAVEEAETVDPYAAEVTTVKSFNLNKPITMTEAIFALDYIDHDFYVYKDVDTDQISVVYKRNAGGIGLIQPEQ